MHESSCITSSARSALRTVRVAAGLTLLAVAGQAWGGGPIVDTRGFEAAAGYSTTYLPSGGYAGQLKGQQGWVGLGDDTATIQSGVGPDGSQAVRVTHGADDYSYWAVQASNYPTGQYVHIGWDMLVQQSTGAGFGPFFGVEPYDDGLEYLGRFGVEAVNGGIVYAQGANKAVPGAFEYATSVVGFNTWNHFDMVLDFDAKRYQGFLNGNLVVDELFVNTASDSFTDADIASLATYFDSESINKPGVSYFDNFFVNDGILGDFDEDADVDGSDLATWQTAYGAGAGADATGDSQSAGGDFLIWQQQLGVDLSVPAPVGAVPEPATWALAATMALVVSGRRRWRARWAN